MSEMTYRIYNLFVLCPCNTVNEKKACDIREWICIL